MIILEKYVYFALGLHLRCYWVQFAAMAGASILGGIMGKKASKAQAAAARRQAAANRKIAYSNAAMIEENASRNLRLSEHGIRFNNLERQEEQFFLNREKEIAIQSKGKVVEEVEAQVDDLKRKSEKEEAAMIAGMAALGLNIFSMTASALRTEIAINTNYEAAWLRHRGQDEQAHLLSEVGLLTHNIERSRALALYDEANARDQATHDNKMALKEAENQRMSGDAGVQVAAAQAKAYKAQGTASLISGAAKAISYMGSADSRTSFGNWKKGTGGLFG